MPDMEDVKAMWEAEAKGMRSDGCGINRHNIPKKKSHEEKKYLSKPEKSRLLISALKKQRTLVEKCMAHAVSNKNMSPPLYQSVIFHYKSILTQIDSELRKY